MTKTAMKLLISFILLLNVSSCSDSTTVEEYLAQAKTSIEAHDHNRAIIALKNAARIEDKNADVRFYLATAYLEQGDYYSAEKELERALKFGANHDLIYAKLIEIKVKLHKFDEAFSVVDLANNRPEAEFIAVLTYAGVAALYSDDQEKAADYIDRAIGISGESAYSALGKGYISLSHQNFSEGIKVVNQLQEAQPNFIEALILKGHLLQSSKQYQKAGDTFFEYAKQRPKEIQIQYLIAQNYLDASQFDLAEKHVDLLLQINKLEPVANQLKAQILFQKNNFVDAKRHAEVAVQQNDALKVSRIIAGFSAYKVNDYEQAYQHLIKVKGDVSSDHIVNKLLIDLQLRLGYDADALSSLRAITNINEMDSSLLTNASYQLLQSGKVEEAKELLKTSISLNSQNPAELAKQGLIQFQLKQSEQGINLLEQALALDPNLEFAENMLAATYLQAEQFDNALKMAKEWQSDDTKAARGYLLESSILLENKQLDAAKVLLEKALTFEPDNIPALYKLALYEHQKENRATAFSYYSKVLNLRSNHVGAVKNLVNLIRKDPTLSGKAIALYNDILAKNPNDEFALFGLSYIYKANKQYDKAIEAFKQLLETSNSITGIELALGDVYKLKGEWDKSIETYKSYLTANPKNLAAAHKVFAVYEQINQLDKSLEYVEKTRGHFPNNKGLLLLKTYYQSMLKEEVLVSDIALLMGTVGIKTHWLFEKTLGNIAYNREDFITAAIHYKSAYEKESNEVNALNWAKSEGLNGNLSKSIEVLERYSNNYAAGVNTKMMLASAYTRDDQANKAASLYEELIDSNSRNVVALNNLASIKLEQGHIESALVYAEKAQVIASNNAIILDTYGQALTANQRIDEAIVIFDKALVYAESASIGEITRNKEKAISLK